MDHQITTLQLGVRTRARDDKFAHKALLKEARELDLEMSYSHDDPAIEEFGDDVSRSMKTIASNAVYAGKRQTTLLNHFHSLKSDLQIEIADLKNTQRILERDIAQLTAEFVDLKKMVNNYGYHIEKNASNLQKQAKHLKETPEPNGN